MITIYHLFYLFSYLPLPLVYFFSNLFYIFLYYLIGYRKKIVKKNLINSFPGQTAQQNKQIAKAFYQHLSDLLFEHIKALTIGPELLLQQVLLKDIDVLERCYQKKQSIILVSGHFCNWEWIANALSLETSYTICAGYQPLHHKGIDRLVLELRSRFKRKAIPMIGLLRHIKRHKGSPEATTILIDQAPLDTTNGAHSIIFLNQATKVSLAPAKLAQKCNQPIFYMQINRIKRGCYQARPVLLTEIPRQLSAQEITEAYMRRLERDIMRNPACWLWSHRRWR